jgi:hypothetical protein
MDEIEKADDIQFCVEQKMNPESEFLCAMCEREQECTIREDCGIDLIMACLYFQEREKGRKNEKGK